MRQKYGFVADVAPDASLSKTGPMSVRFSDVAEKDREADLNSLLIDVRCTTAASSVCARVCAVGCGKETESKKCDTPGFPLRSNDSVDRDHRHASLSGVMRG
jgi:hypothetical protein